MGKYLQKLKDLTREDIILLLIVLSPAILTTILMIIGEADQRETQRRLENRPNITWREIMTPEERKQMGYDHFDEMERTYQQSKNKKVTLDPGKASKGKTEFDKEDFYDIVDYNGGLDGEYSNIDYHDLEDYYGD
ncbi:MAG: hypothetical protein PUH77_08360 [Bacteroidales bacterium]|nr:hypothetical protein [Bacteroidales bacterium]MDY5443135.1 hypothetical protein [Candidatus Cryptobacteroides sp.]